MPAARNSRWGDLLWYVAACACCGLLAAGCAPSAEPRQPEGLWGKRGLGNGRFQKPRAVAIDAQDQLYIVDMTARIQVFDSAGRFVRAWRTPESKNGRPTGLSISRQGQVLVADTHYNRVLFYSAEGKLLRTLGGKLGQRPGEFGLVTDAVQDAQGNYYIAEYGEFDRIQKFSTDGQFLLQWGGHGAEPGEFLRPQDLEFDRHNQLWVADACNHRIQVFDTAGKLLNTWGRHGSGPGQLSYPYDLTFDTQGNLYVCEYGNHRVQKFTPDGVSLGTWGRQGRGPGELFNPWGLVVDSKGLIHVLDSNNHRVQEFRL